MIRTKVSAVSEPTPGCVGSRCASGHSSTPRSTAWLSSAMIGFNRSSNSSRACRRRPTALTGTIPVAVSLFAVTASYTANLRSALPLANRLMIRVRACTIRCRCQSSCRRSRFCRMTLEPCWHQFAPMSSSGRLRGEETRRTGRLAASRPLSRQKLCASMPSSGCQFTNRTHRKIRSRARRSHCTVLADVLVISQVPCGRKGQIKPN